MAIAKFHSLRGEKSALLLVKANLLEFGSKPVYAPRAGVAAISKKELTADTEPFEFEIPDGYTLVPIVDIETGEARTTESGEPLMQLQY